ncbi:hypothetical protein CCACVL1_12508 [Corchorus capsularis]|uniref:Uncharacterized protein n=1 Tax=Corchorus capsularis TaxID=210143 RepID=A0A1R3IFD3_COCAP|nr:hypothetical protein CCACVL1_12508 [Corchorus capsularis]
MGGFGGVCKEGLKKGGYEEEKEKWGLKLKAMPWKRAFEIPLVGRWCAVPARAD